MCRGDMNTTATIWQVLIGFKACLMEAKKPLVAIIVSNILKFAGRKGNGKEDSASALS